MVSALPAAATRGVGNATGIGANAASSLFQDNNIVAMRRINIVDRELDKDGEWVDARKPYIEIEIAIDGIESGSNLQHVIQIGDCDFASSGWTADMHLLYLLEPKDFAALKEGARITYRVGVARDKATISQLAAEGRQTTVAGRRVGRLRKAMVDDFAPIERKPNLQQLQ